MIRSVSKVNVFYRDILVGIIQMAPAAALLKVDFRQQTVDYTNLLALKAVCKENLPAVNELR